MTALYYTTLLIIIYIKEFDYSGIVFLHLTINSNNLQHQGTLYLLRFILEKLIYKWDCVQWNSVFGVFPFGSQLGSKHQNYWMHSCWIDNWKVFSFWQKNPFSQCEKTTPMGWWESSCEEADQQWPPGAGWDVMALCWSLVAEKSAHFCLVWC